MSPKRPPSRNGKRPLTRWLWLLPVVLALGVVATFRGSGEPGPGPTPESVSSEAAVASVSEAVTRLELTTLARHPHDPEAFTQGLVWHEGKLYESTGQYGRSRLRRVNLETGEVELESDLAPNLFGEGLAVIPGTGAEGRDELLWLTWKGGRALRFDLETFAPSGEYRYEGEGWGLCAWEADLYRTDGTAILWRHGPESFDVRGRLEVTRDGAPVGFLNELECTAKGILANVWQSDEIVRIDPRSGVVTATLDASSLWPAGQRRPEAVLNGIAYRPETDTYLLTGKLWPWLFEVALEEPL